MVAHGRLQLGVSVSVPQKAPSFWAPSLGILVLLWRWGTHLAWIMVLYGYSLLSHLSEHLQIFPPFCPSLPLKVSLLPSHPPLLPLTHLGPSRRPASCELHRLGPCSPALDSHGSGPKVTFLQGRQNYGPMDTLNFVKFKIITSS